MAEEALGPLVDQHDDAALVDKRRGARRALQQGARERRSESRSSSVISP
jgi:hypothetical protein